MKTNQEYKNAALAALKGKWAPALLGTVVYLLIAVVISLATEVLDPKTAATGVILVAFVAVLLLTYLVLLPLTVGYYYTHNQLLMNGETAITGNMFKAGFARYGHNLWGMVLMAIFTFLWTLLFIIPGIIKSFAYFLTPYILVDNPELSANEAINLSQKMMKGHKFDLFWLELSFIGWMLLGILTLGIGYIWLMPYMMTATAAFYQDVKAEYLAKTSNVQQ